MLYMMDVRGSCPLSYVPERDYDKWIRFFMSKRDAFWPRQENRTPPAPPSLTLQLPHTRPVKDVRIALPDAITEMLAAGRMDPQEVLFLSQTDDDDEDLRSFVDEGAFKEVLLDDFTETSVNMGFEASESGRYDDVSVSERSEVAQLDDLCKFRLMNTNDSVSSCESRSRHRDAHLVSPAAKIHDDNDCLGKHPIFLRPPFGESNNALGDERLSGGGSEQKVFLGSKISPLLPWQVTNSPCNGMNVVGSAASNPPAVTPPAKKGTYCQPEDDSGLLYGSC
jgi:hypothetical protein